MFDLKSYIADKRRMINTILEKILQDSSGSRRIKDAMHYSLMAGGKRLRPVLCLATVEALAGDPDDEFILNTACALEMIHTYSLIHDDLPAMDNDRLRRGKETCHIVFDEATAILAGDALLTLAFQTLSESTETDEGQALKTLKIIHIISLAAGYKGMIAGQMQDIASEGTSLSIDDLDKMYAFKTGSLLDAAINSGTVLGDATSTQEKQLLVYARSIGLAFQITDDILNVQGDPAVMGKSAGTDEIRKKSTYPLILGVQKSQEITEKLIRNALQSLTGFDKRADSLRAIARYIVNRKR
ncbi:MAG: polyprenyl synthetase family protein [Deltaproteobacteria bacterium]|nr:polyprenyl synthetase family protein [Deltaproteobacteria bacterium]